MVSLRGARFNLGFFNTTEGVGFNPRTQNVNHKKTDLNLKTNMYISAWLDSSCSIPVSIENRLAFPESGIKASISTELLHKEDGKSNYKELFLSLKNELDQEKLLQIGYSNLSDYCDKLKQLCLYYPGKDYVRPYINISWNAINTILADWRKNSDNAPVFILHPGNFILEAKSDAKRFDIILKFTLIA
jgi:hypothetical protein